MRVLMVNSGVFPAPSPLGGTETHVYWLANSLAQAGCEIDLVADTGEAAFHPKVRVHPVGYAAARSIPRSFGGYVIRHLKGGILAARAARKLLRRNKGMYDVVHVHGRWAPYLLSQSCQEPLVFTLHDSPPSRHLKKGMVSRAVYSGSYNVLNLGTARRASAIIAVSPDSLETLERAGVPRDRVVVIPSGVDTGLFQPGTPHSQRTPTFLFVGSLVPRKGVADLLQAMGLVRCGWECVITGDGPERPRLERLARELGVAQRVRFLGTRPIGQVAQLYGRSGVFVLPSLSEGLPMSLLEAMSAGCPVVATRVSGIPSVVDHGREGLLVNPGDVGGLAEAMDRLAGDAAFRERAGNCARAKVEAEYSWASVAARVLAVYRQVKTLGAQMEVSREALGEV